MVSLGGLGRRVSIFSFVISVIRLAMAEVPAATWSCSWAASLGSSRVFRLGCQALVRRGISIRDLIINGYAPRSRWLGARRTLLAPSRQGAAS